MKIVITQDMEGASKDSIVECDEVQGKQLIDEKKAHEYVETKVDVKEVEQRVKEQVSKALVQENKMDIEKKNVEFAIGKMFRQIAGKAITGNSETGSATTGPEVVYTGMAELAPLVYQNSVVYAKCRKIPVPKGATGVKLPIDTSDFVIKATAPIMSGSVAEGIAPTATNLTFTSRTLTMGKTCATVAVTDELLEDNAMMDAWVRQDLVGKIANTLDYEILRGGGGGYTAVNGDTNYCIASAISATPTLAEYQALVSAINQQLNPEFFMSVTDWNLAVGTFGTAANIMNQLIDISGMKILGKKVNVVPCLASGDVILGDFSQYTVIEGPLGDRLRVSDQVNFLTGEVVYRIDHRGAGAASLYKRICGDAKYIGGFSEKS